MDDHKPAGNPVSQGRPGVSAASKTLWWQYSLTARSPKAPSAVGLLHISRDRGGALELAGTRGTHELNQKSLGLLLVIIFAGCATPPSADPSAVDPGRAQQCSTSLATCSSGFKLFPVVQQKPCNDNYDVCIKGCPARTSRPSVLPAKQTTSERLKALDDLYQSGVITKDEYEVKRKQILESL